MSYAPTPFMHKTRETTLAAQVNNQPVACTTILALVPRAQHDLTLRIRNHRTTRPQRAPAETLATVLQARIRVSLSTASSDAVLSSHERCARDRVSAQGSPIRYLRVASLVRVRSQGTS